MSSISLEAAKFIKANKKQIIQKFAGDHICESDANPISIFMAGSPGAGKTEFSKWLLKYAKIKAVRIDPDEIKECIPQYTGKNSNEVQGASALAVEYLYDYVLKKKKNMLLDGTFSDYKKSYSNVKRSVDKNRHIDIYYLYQDPLIAWKFTKIRGEKEGRFIPKDFFVESFFNAINNVDKVKKEFGKNVTLHLVIKDYENGFENKFRLDIVAVDGFIENKYTKVSLKKALWTV